MSPGDWPSVPVSVPAARVCQLGLGVSARYAQVQKSVKAALVDAAVQARGALRDASPAVSAPMSKAGSTRTNRSCPAISTGWIAMKKIAARASALIDRCNKAGSVASLSPEERSLLKRHGVKRFRTPLYAAFTLPPRCQLGGLLFPAA